MKPRERVEAALRHEEPDRCPLQVGFTPEFAARLAAELRAGAGAEAHNPHGGGNPYELERALGQDALVTSVGWANSYYQQEGSYTDEWGVEWSSVEYDTRFGKGRYTEITGCPLAEDDAIDSYTPPDPHRPALYEHAGWTIREFKDEYWIVAMVATTIFETAWALRGFDRLMMDLFVNPDLAERILDIPFAYHMACARKLADMGVDMIWLGDDVGMQTGMLISPETWRRFLKPRLARVIATCKEANPEVKIVYHTDGDVMAIIPELMEIGLDVLNPVQPACMDPAELKERYGDRLCFWGTIDEQHTLPFGSPEDVREEILLRLRTVGRGGGLVLAPTHNVQLDTPLENFRAMVDTIKDTPYASLH
ncbi:MAG: uroporphyrinogen decarboxylase family protein [Planctomycetota bacterium]